MNTENKVVVKSNLRMPESFELYPHHVMSNFDGEVDNEVADFIKNKKLYAYYAGWNFSGCVWFEGEMWNCEVWCYHNYEKTFNANTLQEIMTAVSDEYGYD